MPVVETESCTVTNHVAPDPAVLVAIPETTGATENVAGKVQITDVALIKELPDAVAILPKSKV
jgi:hypothetical protein